MKVAVDWTMDSTSVQHCWLPFQHLQCSWLELHPCNAVLCVCVEVQPVTARRINGTRQTIKWQSREMVHDNNTDGRRFN